MEYPLNLVKHVYVPDPAYFLRWEAPNAQTIYVCPLKLRKFSVVEKQDCSGWVAERQIEVLGEYKIDDEKPGPRAMRLKVLLDARLEKRAVKNEWHKLCKQTLVGKMGVNVWNALTYGRGSLEKTFKTSVTAAAVLLPRLADFLKRRLPSKNEDWDKMAAVTECGNWKCSLTHTELCAIFGSERIIRRREKCTLLSEAFTVHAGGTASFSWRASVLSLSVQMFLNKVSDIQRQQKKQRRKKKFKKSEICSHFRMHFVFTQRQSQSLDG